MFTRKNWWLVWCGAMGIALWLFLLNAEVLASTETLPTMTAAAPILIVDAGVLPTSRFYFLDKFDEWVQKNIFTFGINSFRAKAALESAAEHVAELQFLNAQGMLTNKIAQALLASWQDNMVFAATIVGNDFAHGGRPVQLADETFRTMLASVDAIQTEYAGNIGDEEQRLILADNFLSHTEEQITSSLLPETAGIPDQVLRLITDDVMMEVQKSLEKIKATLVEEKSSSVKRAGSLSLLELAAQDEQSAKDYYEKNNFRAALENLEEARRALRLVMNDKLAIEMDVIVDKTELNSRLDETVDLLVESGLVDVAEIDAERAKISAAYLE